jgi:hypothetical protein
MGALWELCVSCVSVFGVRGMAMAHMRSNMRGSRPTARVHGAGGAGMVAPSHDVRRMIVVCRRIVARHGPRAPGREAL